MKDIKISEDTLILSEYEKHLLKIFKFHYINVDYNIGCQIQKAITLLHKRTYCLGSNGISFKYILPLVLENSNKLLYKLCNSKLYYGRNYMDLITEINNDVFFKTIFDTKKEFTKDEVAYDYFRKIQSRLQGTTVVAYVKKEVEIDGKNEIVYEEKLVYDLLNTDELLDDIVIGLEKYNKKCNRFKNYKRRYKKQLELEKILKNTLEFKEVEYPKYDTISIMENKCNVAVYNVYKDGEDICSFDYEILKLNKRDSIIISKDKKVVLKIRNKYYISDYYNFSRILYTNDMETEYNRCKDANDDNSETMLDFIKRNNIVEDLRDKKIDFCIELMK